MKFALAPALLSAAAILLGACAKNSSEASDAAASPEAQAATYVNLDDDSFASFAAASNVAVVDFWAPWCAPCHRMAPIFSEVSSEFQGKAAFAKVNVDDSPKTSQSQKITGIPAILIYKEGALVDSVVGVVSAEHLRARVARQL